MSLHLTPTGVTDTLRPFVEAGILGVAEIHMARTLGKVAVPVGHQVTDSEIFALAFAVWAVNASHVCLDLADIEQQVSSEIVQQTGEAVAHRISSLPWPDPSTLVSDLSRSPLVGTPAPHPSSVDTSRPLILSDTLLYFTRQWIDEGIVVDLLADRFSQRSAELTPEADEWARAAFTEPDGIDRAQVDAVRSVLTSKSVVLLGGPGTGKTYTIAAMLHALAERRRTDGGPELRVALAAPTAKAAQQMTSSISGSIASKDFPPTHSESISRWATSAQTVHSLLGVRSGNLVRFRHGTRSPLRSDVLIVDEVSMVSLPLMARLLEAVPRDATLVLVGDPQQLQSIETGAVLGEIERFSGRLPNIKTLKENRRQLVRSPDGSVALNAIGTIAARMRADGEENIDIESVLSNLSEPGDNSVAWIETPAGISPTIASVISALENDLVPFSDARIAAESFSSRDSAMELPHRALKSIESVRILCAHREGDWGVATWNRLAERLAGVEKALRSPGRPLLVTRNDRSIGLNNGDTGVVIGNTGTNAAFRVQGGANHDDVASARILEMSALADIETAFAMTVHKSQGSQYDTVVFVVPPQGSPLLQREMVYTAVTRAKRRLVVVGDRASIAQALGSRSRRRSSLADRIRAALSPPKG